VTRDAVQFRGDDANVLRAGRDLEFCGPFHCPDKGVSVGERGEVIDAAGVGQKLGVGPVLAHLLMHPMDVTANRFGPDNVLAIHGHLYPQDTVGGRVLRPMFRTKVSLVEPGEEMASLTITRRNPS